MNSTITILTVMTSCQNSIQNEVLMEMSTHTHCNTVAKGSLMKARIELTVESNKFYLKICQRFLQALIGMLNTQKLNPKACVSKTFFLFPINTHCFY